MKKLVKVLALVLALTLAMAPATEAQAATTTLKMNATNDTFFAAKSSKKTVTKTGNYNVKISKKVKNGQAGSFIDFKAPKAGVYQIKMSNLHCAKNKEGINTKMSVCMWVVDKYYCDVSRTYYFANTKDRNNVLLMSKRMYNLQVKIDNVREHPEFVKTTTINCKLRKGDHLVIGLNNFDGLDGLGTVDTYAFDMKITKKK